MHVQINSDAVAEAVLVAGGEITVNATANGLALGFYGDVLGNVHASVAQDIDRAVITGDFLAGMDLAGRNQQADKQNKLEIGRASCRVRDRTPSDGAQVHTRQTIGALSAK